MATISQFKKQFPEQALRTLLNQVKENIGGDFDFIINENSKSVKLINLPSQYKDNVFESVSDLGFVPTSI